MRFLLFVCFVCITFLNACGKLKIGGIFYDDRYESERAYNSVISADVFNAQRKIGLIKHTIAKDDIFTTVQTLCNMIKLNTGVVGVFSPGLPSTHPIIHSVTSKLKVPYMHVLWTPTFKTFSETHLNFFPDSDLYVRGMGVIVNHLMWNSFVVLYESNDGLVRLQDVLKIKNYRNGRYSTIKLKQLGSGPDYRSVLKELRNTSDVNIILDCESDRVLTVLQQAKEVKRLDNFHNYFLTSLDAHTLDFTSLNVTANITTVRIVDPINLNVIRAAKHWEQLEFVKGNFNTEVNSKQVKAEEALMYDATSIFLVALRDLHITQPVKSKLRCNENFQYEDGSRIVSYMRNLTYESSLTGPISFDAEGNRIDFILEVVEHKNNNFRPIAKWSPALKDSVNYTRSEVENLQQIEEDLQKMTVIVASRIGPPYLRFKDAKEGEVLEGNGRYEGYSMDLIAAIADILNFTFKFEIIKEYGKYDPRTKKWTGLFKELLDRRAHLAICDLTITHERQEVVDFSSPFMSLGISILYKKAAKNPPGLLSFMDPFSFDVWIYTATLYLVVSIMLYFIARMAPGDWENSNPLEQNPDELENIWNLKNCLWLTIGSLMIQGCDIVPKGISSRMTISMWFIFAIIVTNSYMASLAAFLTAVKMGPTIDSVEALAKQTKIKYGTLEGGTTEAFFKNSNFSTYQRMWTQMLSSKPNVFEKTNSDGVNRVKTTKNNLYAFLMESSSIEYEVQRNCDLQKVGTWLDNKNYGIAMPMNSKYRSLINRAILSLSENGKLKELKTKWWKTKNPKECEEQEDTNKSGKLALDDVGGVFLVLLFGIAAALLLSILEFLWNIRNISVDEHITYWEALKHELRFALSIWEMKKRAKPLLSESSHSAVANAPSLSNFSVNEIGFVNTCRQDE